MTHKYTNFPDTFMKVISLTHTRFGFLVLKFCFNMFVQGNTLSVLADLNIDLTVDVKGIGGRRKGEIDIGTNEFIIECIDGMTNTSKNAGNFLKYFEGHVDYKYINTNGKKVIPYSSSPIDINKENNIESLDVIVISDQDTLIKTI